MNNATKFLGIVAAVAIGIFIALFAYQEYRSFQFELREEERLAAEVALEVERLSAINAAEEILHELVANEKTLEITGLQNALGEIDESPSIRPSGAGWYVDGYYRRMEETDTHRYTVEVDSSGTMVRVVITEDDSDFLEKAEADPRITAVY